ncbi:MAG: cytochrome P450 [Halobacteriovoraceae bacterium]|jgi:cytochrome P450|nr:cytochrome P450 [Halobacteriovoraceae bacterium]
METKIPGPNFRESVKYLFRIFNEERSYVYQELAQKYGDVVTLKLPVKIVFLFNPKDIGIILMGNHLKVRKSKSYKYFFPLIGKGLVTAEGLAWKKQRSFASPHFSKKSTDTKLPLMVNKTKELVSRISSEIDKGSSEFDTLELLGNHTFSIITQALFDFSAGENEKKIQKHAIKLEQTLVKRIFSLIKLPTYIPTAKNKEYNNGIEQLNNAVYSIIDSQLESKSNSFLGSLIRSDFSKKIIRDEIVTYLIAGYETTNLAINWTLILLCQNPDKLHRLTEEIQRVMSNDELTIEKVNKLEYLKSVINEAMRIYPPVPFLSRESVEDIELSNKYVLKKDSIIICSQFVTHRDARYWPNPLEFKPDRFKDEKLIEKFTFFPFAEGPRKCIGAGFSKQEIICFFAYFIKDFEFSLADSDKIDHFSSITLKPDRKIALKIKKRIT